MNEAIELHDSELERVTVVEGQGIQLVMLDKPEYREEFGGTSGA